MNTIIKDLFNKDADLLTNLKIFNKDDKKWLLYLIYESYSNQYNKSLWLKNYINNINGDVEDYLYYNLQSLEEYKKKEEIKLNLDVGNVVLQEGIYTCKKCGGKYFTYETRQTRSIDEGASVFKKCQTCGAESHEK